MSKKKEGSAAERLERLRSYIKNLLPPWSVSGRGNPTRVVDDRRLTVFKAKKGGYKFMIAWTGASDRDPMFGRNPYETDTEAQDAAMIALKRYR